VIVLAAALLVPALAARADAGHSAGLRAANPAAETSAAQSPQTLTSIRTPRTTDSTIPSTPTPTPTPTPAQTTSSTSTTSTTSSTSTTSPTSTTSSPPTTLSAPEPAATTPRLVRGVTPLRSTHTRGKPTPPPTPEVTGCAGTPSACGYPDATNTGVSDGVTLKQSGCIHATTPGQVISGVWVKNCAISIEAPNVVIRDVKVTNTDVEMWAIIVREGASATFSNVEVAGNGQGASSVEYAILSQTSSRVTIDRADLYNCADCVQGENIVMTNSFIHDLANPPGAHVDGFQCNGSCGVTLRHNTILNPWSQTSAIALFADFGSPRASLIQDNLLAGGGYTVYGGTSVATGIRILDNRFARQYYRTGGYWGYIADFRLNNTGNEWSGNVWDDTGASVGS
jgi:hypothetical protein